MSLERGSFDDMLADELREHELDRIDDDACPPCRRVFGADCPQGWVALADGQCLAPKAYRGPCRGIAYFNRMGIGEKRSYQRRCLGCWPCDRSGGLAMVPVISPILGDDVFGQSTEATIAEQLVGV